MLPPPTTRTFLAAGLLLTAACAGLAAADRSWPQFRGSGGLAVAEQGNLPTHFGPHTNVVWQTPLPPGHSSPCITGQKIFLTVLDGAKLATVCLDRRDGRVLWQQNAPTDKLEPTHRISNPAASTPATDGRSVFVYFGSFGLLAYDLAGREQWRVPLPVPLVEFGAGTSPILAGELVILICDQDQGSFLLAVNKRTGRTVWRTERSEFRRGFASPFLWQHDREEELIVPGSIWLRSYHLKDGTERWSFSGTSRVANSTPTAGDGLLFSASWNIGGDPSDRVTMEPFAQFAAENNRDKNARLTKDEIPAGPVRDRFSQMDINKDGLVTAAEWEMMREMFAKTGNAVLALRPGGKGDITTSHLAWKSMRSLPYVCSPVYYRGRLYTVKNGGLASCYEARSGKPLYQDERLDAAGDYYASLVAGGGRIFAASQKGVLTVWEAGDALNIMARNDLGDQIMATPALVEDRLYVRTAGRLYAFGR